MRSLCLMLIASMVSLAFATPPLRPGDAAPYADLPESPTLRSRQDAIADARPPEDLAGRFGVAGVAEVVSRLARDAEPGTRALVVALRDALVGAGVDWPDPVKAMEAAADPPPISADEAGRVWALVQHLGAATGARLADGQVADPDDFDAALRERLVVAVAEHAPSAAIRWQIASHVCRRVAPPAWLPAEAIGTSKPPWYTAAAARRAFQGLAAAALDAPVDEGLGDDRTIALAAMAMDATLQLGVMLIVIDDPDRGGERATARLAAWRQRLDAMTDAAAFRTARTALDRLEQQVAYLQKDIDRGRARQLQLQRDGYERILQFLDAVNREDRRGLASIVHPARLAALREAQSLRDLLGDREGVAAIVPAKWGMVGGSLEEPELEVELRVIGGDGATVKRSMGFELSPTDAGLRLGRPD